jgi:hypothetical protein
MVPPSAPSMRRVSVAGPDLSDHPQISSEAFSAGSGVGSFRPSAFSGKDVHVARLRAFVVAVLLLLLLGCEDEPTPDLPEPPSSSAPSPTETGSGPTTSPTPEVLTPEGTVRAWVDARNSALQDGDTTGVRALTHASCQSCIDLITSIEEVYAAGGSFQTKGWRVKASKTRNADGPHPRVTAGLVIAGGRTISEAGAEPVAYERDKRLAVFKVHQVDAAFVVDFVGFLS